jgi:phospholipase/lecithinase/hemolysin
VFTQLTGVHNALLAQSLDGLEVQLAGVKIVRIDVFALTQALAGGIVDPPALEFLTGDPGAPFCLFTDPMTCPDVSSEFDLAATYIFWDAEHPTTLVHGLLGQAMFEALQQ